MLFSFQTLAWTKNSLTEITKILYWKDTAHITSTEQLKVIITLTIKINSLTYE